MKKTMTVASVIALSFGLFGGVASANTTREAACQAIDSGANVVATYTAGNASSGAQDSCVVVSTARTYTESVERVNNPRAAKAVERVTISENLVTTTQAYRWNTANVNGGGQIWVAAGDPLTEAEILQAEQCMRNPGNPDC